jgi:O-antigen/teichoic acid export membrane protein
MAGARVSGSDMPNPEAVGFPTPARDASFGEGSEGLGFEDRIPAAAGGLRQHAARGTIINASFRVGISGLAFVQRILVAAFLTPAELGTWGIVLITLLTLLFVKNVGISDKYIQQSEPDQERAFQKAFTFEILVTAAFVGLAIVTLPLFALAYGNPSIILPGVVLSLAGLGNSFQAPIWIFYRRMEFVRQRTLETIDPIVTFVVTIGLAIAGMGYWSLVIGAVAGAWSGGLIAVLASPYKLRFLPDRATTREYLSFSWPLAVAKLSGLAIGQGSLLVGAHAVGLDGVGAITLAISITAFADGVDAIVTQTIYPAICAVRHRLDLLLESFVKSNRLALMWGVPFGLALTLFASDLVEFVIGDKWRSAVFLLQVFGVIAAIDQIGFNWTAFLRARNQTRPLAIVGIVSVASFLLITVPLLIADGLHGYAWGMLGMTLTTLAARTYYLARLFDGFRVLWHAGRAIAPSIPAVLAVLAMRAVEQGGRSAGMALAELAVYVAVTVAATALLERSLLREMLGYLRRPQVAAAGATE